MPQHLNTHLILIHYPTISILGGETLQKRIHELPHKNAELIEAVQKREDEFYTIRLDNNYYSRAERHEHYKNSQRE